MSRQITLVQLALVVPCYNEGEMLPISLPQLLNCMGEWVAEGHCASNSFILLVDDASRDNTWDLISEAAKQYPRRIKGVRLAANAGHQGALLCGLQQVTGHCDAVVSIDADLQDDLAAIPLMLQEYRQGAEIVLGVRDSRDSDTWFKRNSARAFYRLMNKLGLDLVENHADFRLLSAKALRSLMQFSEVNLFLRGLPPLLHQRIRHVYYRRAERLAGESKYPLGKMFGLAWNGITSFSVMPLRLIAFTGAVVFLVSLLMTVYALGSLALGSSIQGWTSIVIPMYLLGGLLMLSLGIVGEYIGKVFLEVKHRPLFLIDALTDETDDDA